MAMEVLLSQIFIIFGMIGLGIIAERISVTNDESSKVLSEILMKIILPISILSSANVSSAKNAVAEMFLGALLMLIFFCCEIFICEVLAHRLKMSKPYRAVFISMTVFPNSAFIGIPLLYAILGSEGAIFAVSGMLSYNALFFTYATSLYNSTSKTNWKDILFTYNNGAICILMVMLLFDLRFPPVVQSLLSQVSAMTTPLALMVVGTMLSRSSLWNMLKNKKLYLISTLRCVVFPLAFILIISRFSFSPVMCIAVTIMNACPSGSMNAVLARQYNMEPVLASEAVAQSTLVILISMPLLISLAYLLY